MGSEKKRVVMIETDARSRVVLPGHPNQQFILHEQSDGSIFLEPAVVISQAQHEYNTNPELREMLNRAANSPRRTMSVERPPN